MAAQFNVRTHAPKGGEPGFDLADEGCSRNNAKRSLSVRKVDSRNISGLTRYHDSVAPDVGNRDSNQQINQTEKTMELNTDKIKKELKRINQNESWLAKKCKVSRQLVSYWLKTGSMAGIARIAKALDINERDLLK